MTFAHDDTLVAYLDLGLGIRKLLKPIFSKKLRFSKRIIMVFSHLNRRAFITRPLSRVYTIMNQVLHIFKIDFDLFIKIDSNSTNFG